MSEKGKNAQAGDAAYGHALLCNRGGWTLREMLGSDYEKFAAASEASFAQKDFQESPAASRSVEQTVEQSEPALPNKANGGLQPHP